jgi:CRISPR/Cas system CMR-associated protein Cmr1 (group 7 of RAMP superfamily)
MAKKYLDAKEFKEFKTNQETLIKVLNHNMTRLSNDVSWLKKLNGWHLGLVATLTITVMVKMFIG